jgi:hypothetical protein
MTAAKLPAIAAGRRVAVRPMGGPFLRSKPSDRKIRYRSHEERERAPVASRGLGLSLALPMLKKETHHLSTGIRPPRVRAGSSGVATGPCVTEAMDNPLFHHLVPAFVGVRGAGITNAIRRPSSADRNPRVYCVPLSKYEWVGDHCESNELSLHPGQNPWTGGSEQFCSDCPSDCLI